MFLAVARVHRTFSSSKRGPSACRCCSISATCATFSNALACDIKIMGVEVGVPVAQILPIGLIVNELATNAKKHGMVPTKW